jgi:hypothetical protein
MLGERTRLGAGRGRLDATSSAGNRRAEPAIWMFVRLSGGGAGECTRGRVRSPAGTRLRRSPAIRAQP